MFSRINCLYTGKSGSGKIYILIYFTPWRILIELARSSFFVRNFKISLFKLKSPDFLNKNIHYTQILKVLGLELSINSWSLFLLLFSINNKDTKTTSMTSLTYMPFGSIFSVIFRFIKKRAATHIKKERNYLWLT